jgi:PPOX class probable F420-dependent enzyme
MPSLPADVRALFDGANFAHIATISPDGAPGSVSIWIGTEGERLVFFTGESTRKARNLQADPRLALSIVDFDNPYRMATVRGRVAEIVRGEPGLEIVDRLSHKYTGEPYPDRTMVAYLVEPVRTTFMELPIEHSPPGR